MWRVLVAALGTWLAAAGFVLASEAKFEAAMADGGAVSLPLRSATSDITATVTIRNASAQPRRIVPGAELAHSVGAGTLHVPATWTIEGAQPPGGILPVGEAVTYRLAATLPERGSYSVAVTGHTESSTGANDEKWRVILAVEWTAAPIAAPTVALTSVPVQVTAPPIWERAGPAPSVSISLRNGGTDAIILDAPRVFSAQEVNGDAKRGLLTPVPATVSAGNCGSSVAPAAQCALELKPGVFPGPGQYQLGVGVAGAGGGWVETTQTVNVRRSWLCAFLVISAGVLAGWIVQWWQSSGRTAAQAVFGLQSSADRLGMIAPSVTNPDFRVLMESLAAELQAAQARTRIGTADAAEVTRLSGRVQQLVDARACWDAFSKIDPQGRQFLSRRWDVLVTKLNAPWSEALDPNAFQSLLRALASDMQAWPDVSSNFQRAGRMETVLPVLATACGTAAFRTLAETLRTDVKDLGPATPLPAVSEGAESGAQRAARLLEAVEACERSAAPLADAARKDLLAKLGDTPEGLALRGMLNGLSFVPGPELADTLKSLAEGWGKYNANPALFQPQAMASGGGVQAEALGGTAGGPATPVSLPELVRPDTVPAFLQPHAGASVAEIERVITRNDMLVLAVTVVIAGLGGVSTLWAGNFTWGSFGDIAGAFLAGAAAQVVIKRVT